MFKIKGQNMHLNRGDAISITINCNESFLPGDTLKFSVCKKGDYSSIIFQKSFTIEEETYSYTMNFTSDDTRLGVPLKSASVSYWYEIELNGNTTLIGFDESGAKEFILYPEATEI